MVVRVLHLVGSVVSDFHVDLSRLYAGDCLSVVAGAPGFEHHIAYLTPDRLWRFPAGLAPAALAAADAVPVDEAVRVIRSLGVDVMVPQMFCIPGMTHYRALFDVLGIPYVGNPAAAMALSADKARCRAVVGAAGVDVPAAELLRRGEPTTMHPPVVVKPVDADNSDGVSLVRDTDGYDAALASAFAQSDRALVERYVELGREVRCGLLVRDGRLVGLPLEEYAVDPDTKPVRLRDDKLDRTTSGDLRLVAKDGDHAWMVDADDPVTRSVHEAAVRCHEALGCRDYSLFDFRIDPDGRPWFLEASLYCSFAPSSVLVTMAAAAGIAVQQLFETAVTTAHAGGAAR